METISLANLAVAFIPVIVVMLIIWRWGMGYKASVYAVFRMMPAFIEWMRSHVYLLNK
jgi:hypothetical protein